MALAFDAAAATNSVFVTSITWAHVSAGDFMAGWGKQARNSGGTTLTGMTFNGDAMTEQLQQAYALSASGANVRIALYSLVSPDAGTFNCVLSLNDGNGQPFGSSITYTGVDSGTPVSNVGTASGSSTTPSLTVSSATGKLVLLGIQGFSSSNNLLPAAPAVQRSTNGSGRSQIWEEAGASSVVIDGTCTASDDWYCIGFSLNEAAAAGGDELMDSRRMLALVV